ncbi:MAG: GNAT family N-acetyltransferase [Candidatus Dormibacteria bacterium]
MQPPRMVLVAMEPEDAGEVLLGIRSNDWAPDYPTDGDLVIARLAVERPSVLESRPWVPYRIIVGESNTVAGGCGFLGPPDSAGVVEIGYGLAPSHRGQGLATEAVRVLLETARSARAASTVIAHTDPANLASQRVLERCGFTRAGLRGGDLRWERAIDRESQPT